MAADLVDKNKRIIRFSDSTSPPTSRYNVSWEGMNE